MCARVAADKALWLDVAARERSAEALVAAAAPPKPAPAGAAPKALEPDPELEDEQCAECQGRGAVFVMRLHKSDSCKSDTWGTNRGEDTVFLRCVHCLTQWSTSA